MGKTASGGDFGRNAEKTGGSGGIVFPVWSGENSGVLPYGIPIPPVFPPPSPGEWGKAHPSRMLFVRLVMPVLKLGFDSSISSVRAREDRIVEWSRPKMSPMSCRDRLVMTRTR